MTTETIPPMRERILEVGRLLFAKNGFHGTSMRDIAKGLDVSVSAVYNHFTSKDAILLEVLRGPIVEMIEQLGAELALCQEAQPRERLTRCIGLHYRRMLDFRLDAELINSEYLRLSDEARPEIVKLRNMYESAFRHLIADYVGKRADVSAITNIVLGLTSTTHRWVNPQGPLTPEAMAGLFVRFALAALDEFRGEITASMDSPKTG